MSQTELRREVLEAVRRMDRLGFMAGTFGSVSARVSANSMLITPEGGGPEDLLLTDHRGEVLEGSLKPPAEVLVHARVYLVLHAVGAVVCAQPPYATVLACLGWEIPPVHPMVTLISGEGRVPVTQRAPFGTERFAINVQTRLSGGLKACLVRSNGAVSVGETPAEALSHLLLLEEVSKIYYRAMLAGEPEVLEEEDVLQSARRFFPAEREVEDCAHTAGSEPNR